MLNPPSLGEPIVVDAKYKSVEGRTVERISAEDLYEMLAFLTAQESRIAILVYPGGALSPEEADSGTLLTFDKITIGTRRVAGATLSTSGIGSRYGYVKFGQRLTEGLLNIARPKVGPAN